MNAQSAIGVVGSKGDLGSQLVQRLRENGLEVIESNRQANSPTVQEVIEQARIIHICAPLSALDGIKLPASDRVIVLHDSVMSSSKQASIDHLNDAGSIAHMLMNSHETVVIEKETPHFDEIRYHFESINYTTVPMSIEEHDRLMAESQAPFALLCQVIHEPLKKYRSEGLLTPSGELLAQTLDARALAWTPETIYSILKNPELKNLLNDMQSTLEKLS